MTLYNICKNSYDQIKDNLVFAYNNPKDAIFNKKTALSILAVAVLGGSSYALKNSLQGTTLKAAVKFYQGTPSVQKETALKGLGLSLLGLGAYKLYKGIESAFRFDSPELIINQP
ncbi:MAG: hypothetical protein ACOVOR_00500 [Rhabdochlamydiaceae bacterium]